MKKLYAFFILLLFFTFQTVSAQTGYCGTNVQYTISGDTISFSRKVVTVDPDYPEPPAYVLDSNCVDIIKNNSSIKKIKIIENMSAGYGNQFFANLENVQEMDLRRLSLPKGGWAEWHGVFKGCSSLKSLNISGWDTSDVTNMSYMFYGCSSLTSLDVSGWNTSNVTDMNHMFYGCSSLTSLDVSKWNTANVIDMRGVFSGCNSLTSLDVSGWNVLNVTKMSFIFYQCSSLTDLDVSKWNTSNVTDMKGLFAGCSSIPSLDISGWNTSNVTDMNGLFSGCSSIPSLDISGWNTSNVTNMANLFSGCSSLTNLDVSKWDTSKVTDMKCMFQICSSLTSLDINGWNTSNVTDMGYMFNQCSSLTNLNLNNWKTSNVTNMEALFQMCGALKSVNISNWNTSKVTNMRQVFLECTSLTGVDIKNWNTGNLQTTHYMFDGCSSLASLDLSGWNMQNAQDIASMFSGCKALKSLDISTWDTANVTYMNGMFVDCSSLASLNLSGWKVSKVTEMAGMFYGCSSLFSLDVSSWNPSNVTNMSYMFYGCSSLDSLDLSSWNTSKVTDMKNTFAGCDLLHTLTLGANTVRKNIFTSLPAYNDPWYYIEKAGIATDPLDLSAVKKNAALFTSYDPIKMAGTWSTEGYISLKVTTSDDQKKIDRFYYTYGSLLGHVSGEDKDTVLSDINYYISVSDPASINGDAEIVLPEGFSFEYNELKTRLPVTIEDGASGMVKIYPLFLSESQKNSTLEFKVTGCIESTLKIPVSVFADQGRVKAKRTGDTDASENIEDDKGNVIIKGIEPIDLDPINDFSASKTTSFNSRLVRMGVTLSFAAYNKDYVTDSLRNLGYLEPKVYNYGDTQINGIACAVGIRSLIEGNKVIHQLAVAVRGTTGNEWIGNGEVYSWKNLLSEDPGESLKVHKSFKDAANLVSSYVDEYLSFYKEFGKISDGNKRVFVTGHSRGGAVVDLYMHDLNEKFGEKIGTAYTFAAANSTTNPSEDKNIFNILNEYDAVPHVPVGKFDEKDWDKYGRIWGKYGRNYVFQGNPDSELNHLHLKWVVSVYLGKEMLNRASSAGLKWGFAVKPYIWNKIVSKFFPTKYANDPHSWEMYWSAVENNRYAYCNWEMVTEDYYSDVDKKADQIREKLRQNYPDEPENYVEEEVIIALANSIIYDDSEILFKIACPVNVEIIDESGKTAAKFENHNIVTIDDSIGMGISHGEIDYVVLKNDQKYTVYIDALENGTMDVQMLRVSDDLDVTDSRYHPQYPIVKGSRYKMFYSTEEELPLILAEGAPLVKTVDILNPYSLIITGRQFWTANKNSQLKAIAAPSNAVQYFGWKSDDESIAAVDATGKVTFKTRGTVKITATALDGSNVSSWILLTYVPANTYIRIMDEENNDITGKSTAMTACGMQLRADVDPSVSSRSVDWYLLNSDSSYVAQNSYVSISPNGYVSYIRGGASVYVYAFGGDRESSYTNLQVLPKTGSIEIIRNGTNYTGKSITVNVNKPQFSANVKDTAGVKFDPQRFLTWKSSDESIAVADASGILTFKKAGTVKLEASVNDCSGKSAWVNVTYVSQPPVLEIKDSNIRGKNKEIQITIPWNSELTKVECTLYNDETGQKVSMTMKERMDSTGKNRIISYVGNPLVNGTVYRFKVRVYNGQWSNYVEKYAMPIANVYGATVVAGNKTMVINNQWRENTTGTRYMLCDADTEKEIAYKVGTKSNTTWTYSQLTNSKLYFVIAVPYRDYKSQRLWGPNQMRIYFMPMGIPGNGKVTFTNNTTAEVSIGNDSTVNGIRVLYRTVGGALKNGCEGAGNKCKVSGLNKNTAYEFYVMKYKTAQGKKYYSMGTLIPYKTALSGLKAPQNNPVVTMTNSGYTTFSIKKAAEADGISVLYREGEGAFQQACEKAGNSCSATLSTAKNYTFYIMQYKVVSGKKLYSNGIVARDFSSGKSADMERLYTKFYPADEILSEDEIIALPDGYQSEDSLLMAEALEVLAADMEAVTETEPKSADEIILDPDDHFLTESLEREEMEKALTGAAENVPAEEASEAGSEPKQAPGITEDHQEPQLKPLSWLTDAELPATGFSAVHVTQLAARPQGLAYRRTGLTLQIPRLTVTETIVTVPLDGGSYPVEWLGSQIGLLEESSLPGRGITVLTGHNHLNTMEAGPFLFIKELDENDRIMITDAENNVNVYRVYGNYKIASDDFAAAADHVHPNALVLLTCEDESVEGGYLNRRVILAEPMSAE